MGFARRALVCTATLATVAAMAEGQPRQDETAQARAKAIRAQQRFESYRRRQLPVTYGRSGASECDIRIGRFCYWHDDAGEPPAEPERVAAARDAFLSALDSAATLTPTDAWVAGQRVRYLIEARRPSDALSAATACRADGWWCAALLGFAQHTLGAHAESDAAFARALAAMPGRQRCEWTDLSDLLPDGFTKPYRAVPCDQRDSVNARVWWLADPRWASGGNDLRTETYARLTMAELVQRARSAHNMAWGDDMAELMLRYGWPTSWSRTPPSMADPASVSVVGHEPSPSFEFMPVANALRDPERVELESWTPLAPRPNTRYAPSYARHFRELTPQVAWFARGDSAVVVVGYDVGLERDTAFTRDTVDAAVVLSRSPGDAAIARARSGPRRGALTVPTSRTPAIVSVEVIDSAARAYARARFATKPSADSMLSDLLLFDSSAGLPETFDDAAALALGTMAVERSTPFGVYWELYRTLAQAAEVTYAVTVERVGPGLMRRLAERVRMAQPVRPVQLSFEDRRRTASRSLVVDVSHIPRGRYRLTLRAIAARDTATAQRDIEVK